MGLHVSVVGFATDSGAAGSISRHARRPPEEQGGDPCLRGDWCAGRTVSIQDGQRIVSPRRTYRNYCDPCAGYLAGCADELGDLYQRLEDAIGDPLQAEVRVHSPFGPQLPLREDIDAHMRLMAALLPGWEDRVSATARLSRPSPERVTTPCRPSRGPAPPSPRT